MLIENEARSLSLPELWEWRIARPSRLLATAAAWPEARDLLVVQHRTFSYKNLCHTAGCSLRAGEEHGRLLQGVMQLSYLVHNPREIRKSVGDLNNNELVTDMAFSRIMTVLILLALVLNPTRGPEEIGLLSKQQLIC